jgi:hypothetical protein
MELLRTSKILPILIDLLIYYTKLDTEPDTGYTRRAAKISFAA